mmetsp:Transcript_20631/g.36670  ORF Transcript_20631/g.36670 Transcript_20631/m.36670 type:complete len:154 (+) Transcript_20631:110-571(+)
MLRAFSRGSVMLGRSNAARMVPAAGSQQAMQLATKSERPVSPHVMIYAWPLSAISSITTRITGVMLTVGVYGIGIGALVGADMPMIAAQIGSSGIGPLVKAGVAFPLTYHTLAAVRHVYWEKYPEGLNVDTQKTSSLGLYAAAGGISLVSMVV